MIIVRLRGGLGNQMFQYAFAEYMKRYDSEVYLDDSEGRCFKCHDGFEVEKIFSVSFPKASFFKICKYADYIPVIGHTIWSHSWFNKMLAYEQEKIKRRGYCKATHIYESEFSRLTDEQIQELIRKHKVIYLDGYWCDTKYLDSIEVEHFFEFRDEYLKKYMNFYKIIEGKKTCSVHFRRGDYVDTELDICGKEYYANAVARIKQCVGEDVLFIGFSNDIDSAKEIVGNDIEIEFIDTRKQNTAGIDLFLMSKCTHNIIANSTFSYWGAKLNKNPNKIVIEPNGYIRV